MYIDLIVGEDEVHYEGVINDIPQVDQVYLEPADHSVAPRLYPISVIAAVNGRGFRAADYQVAASPGLPQGRPGSLASASAIPELSPYNGQFPPLRVVQPTKRKGTKRKPKSPSPPPKAKTFTFRNSKGVSTTAANSTAKLANAKAKLAAAAAALEKAKKDLKSASGLYRKTKKKSSP